jgi:PAS domain S-box-containing protein
MVRLMLNTGHPMYIWWGEDGACLYNDAYRESIGPERHPGSLGRPAREVWDEIWDIIGPQIEQVMSGGGATWHEDHLVPITRHGRREDVYWTYSYSPIDDETAFRGIGGILVVCTETTQKVLGERRLAEQIESQRQAHAALRESEARYRSALTAGHMGNWETDFVTGTRIWSEEGMALFGLRLADGRGRVGGANDEYSLALHPDDRHLVQEFRDLADRQDSIPAEYRIVRPDGTIRWLSGRGHVVARGTDGKAQRLVSIMADVTDRKAADDHIKFLMREISHRSKNLLSVVQAIAAQTGRSAGTIGEFQMRFSRRLQGLAASHDLLVHQNWQGATLSDLVRDQVAPFVETGSARVSAAGPDVFVSPEAAEALGLALHELATNAVKYGPLSIPTGRVAVSWALENEGTARASLRLSWVERGGPVVTSPSHKGFGHVVFERIITKSLGGNVAMDFAPEGLSWVLSIPTANLVSAQRGLPTAP